MTSRKVGLRRLLKLADHIETVDRKRFDMTVWSNKESANSDSCGTVGCIAGHAVEISSFKRVGYRLSDTTCTGYFAPYYNGVYANEALALFFALDLDEHYLFAETEVDLIFHDKSIRTPKQAAKAIRRFVKNRGKQ